MFSKKIIAIVMAAVMATGLSVGAAWGGDGANPNGRQCKVVSWTTRIEDGRTYTSGGHQYTMRRVVYAQTKKCGGDFTTSIEFGAWVPTVGPVTP